MKQRKITALLSPLALIAASCGVPAVGESPEAQDQEAGATPFTITEIATFDEPWAIAFIPSSPLALITEKAGRLMLWEEGGAVREVAGVPEVAYGGQGGLGDVVLAPGGDGPDASTVYLSWAEAGANDTRGAAVGRARLVLGDTPRLEGLEVIWRQQPKVSGRGHYSHRLAFSPDGAHLYIASGDRQKLDPAQDSTTDLGKMLRLALDGSGAVEQVSSGHRNILGMAFDDEGHLWEVEHGPAGGDELNIVKPGANYGWPKVSEGKHYNGDAIPAHATQPAFVPPVISWTPVIAPGDMIFYRGNQFPAWQGQLLIAAMKPAGIVRVAIAGETASEVARYSTQRRIRAIAEREDGSVWLLEDRAGGRLLKLEPLAAK